MRTRVHHASCNTYALFYHAIALVAMKLKLQLSSAKTATVKYNKAHCFHQCQIIIYKLNVPIFAQKSHFLATYVPTYTLKRLTCMLNEVRTSSLALHLAVWPLKPTVVCLRVGSSTGRVRLRSPHNAQHCTSIIERGRVESEYDVRWGSLTLAPITWQLAREKAWLVYGRNKHGT